MEKAKQWEKIKELFGAALERDPSQRASFLRDACGQDQELRHEVESLLSANENPNALSEPPWQAGLPQNAPGFQSIGPYKLIRKIGEGGMGQVWLAEQTEPVRRQVALKLIRASMYSESLLQRFQHERQSLAMMDHPLIAKVFEAGSTANGQPYLVMEYVPGLPITEYCDQNNLSIRERLELFVKASEGVQHAHQKAVIHRDLKPGNILVVEVDGKPLPRIIDFGLAKAAEPEAGEDKILVTQPGIFVGTPGYMSPEQANPDARDVDTRTDVYSLGVVLYVLLTGSLPFDAQKQPLHEVLRQLREEDPLRPSARIGLEKESSSPRAAMRGTEPAQLAGILRGDLDCIVMKALEKDRTRRYGTPSDLAADIVRYLNQEPVIARPATALYRLQKYVHRHRVGTSVAAGLLLLLAGFAAVQAAQVRRISRERDRADRATQFMTGMFKVSDPSEARGNTITAREILDKASKDIDAGLAKDPELQAQMMDVMGNVYGNLGLYEKARGLLAQAADIRSRVLGPTAPQTLGSRNALSVSLGRLGRFSEAEKIQRETLDVQRRVLGPEHPNTLKSTHDLAWNLYEQGRYPEAEKLLRQTLEAQVRVLGPEHPNTLKSMVDLATIFLAEGRYPDAEKLQSETLDIRRRVFGPDHPDTVGSMVNLARSMFSEGRFAEAEKLQRETLDIRRRLLGPEHPDTLRAMGNLATNLLNQGRYREAEKMEREALEIQSRVLGPEHPDTLVTMINLGWNLEQQGRFDEAGVLESKTLDLQRRVMGPEHPNTLLAMVNLAANMFEVGRYAEAEKLQRETLAIQQRTLGPEHPDALKSKHNLALTLSKEKHFGDAEQMLLETITSERRLLGSKHPDLIHSLFTLASVEARAGRKREALGSLREAIDQGLPASQALEIAKASDFQSLHGDPRFDALVAYAKERVAAVQGSK